MPVVAEQAELEAGVRSEIPAPNNLLGTVGRGAVESILCVAPRLLLSGRVAHRPAPNEKAAEDGFAGVTAAAGAADTGAAAIENPTPEPGALLAAL